jgi:hypothetical protein
MTSVELADAPEAKAPAGIVPVGGILLASDRGGSL